MVLWKFTVREVKNRPGRAILTLASIVIAVSAVVSVRWESPPRVRRTRRCTKVSAAGPPGKSWPGSGFYEQAQVPNLDDIPGVKAVVPLFQYGARLYHDRGRPSMVVMGIDPLKDEAVRDYELQEGTFFDEEGRADGGGLRRQPRHPRGRRNQAVHRQGEPAESAGLVDAQGGGRVQPGGRGFYAPFHGSAVVPALPRSTPQASSSAKRLI